MICQRKKGERGPGLDARTLPRRVKLKQNGSIYQCQMAGNGLIPAADLIGYLQFCPDVQPGNARAKECLEEHREEPDFSPECKTEVEKMMAERAADFRLDSKLKRLCQDDITDMCANERDSLDLVAGLDARVILCLQDLRSASRASLASN